MNFDALKAPFPANKVHWRVGAMTKDKTKGMALAYIDARHVMQRLDDVCGPENWQCRYSHAQGTVVCEIGICVDEYATNVTDGALVRVKQWVWKADGAGATDVEAEKGSLSDAFKRAAVRWGIGRYLYDLPSPWVKLDEYKRIEKDEYGRLRDLLPNGDTAPDPIREPPQEQTGEPTPIPDQPGSWWEKESLHLPVPKDAAGELMWRKWVEDKAGFLARVNKAPSGALLDKLCKDNIDTITHIRENCAQGLWRDVDAAVKARHKHLAEQQPAPAEERKVA